MRKLLRFSSLAVLFLFFGVSAAYSAPVPKTTVKTAIGKATNVTDVAATLNGKITSSVTTTWQFKVTGVNGNQFAWSGPLHSSDPIKGSITAEDGISGLSEKTTYEAQLCAQTSGNAPAWACSAGNFTTISSTVALAPPLVTSLVTSSITTDSATVTITVDSNDPKAAGTAWLEYSLTNGNTWEFATAPVAYSSSRTARSISFSLTGLLPNTTYFVRAHAQDVWGTSTYNNGSSFTTLTPPVIGLPPTVSWVSLTIYDVNVAFNVIYDPRNPYLPDTVWIEYSTDSTFATFSATPPQSFTASDVNSSFWVTGFTPSTKYYYRVIAQNVYGSTTYNDGVGFTTADLMILPTVDSITFDTITLDSAQARVKVSNHDLTREATVCLYTYPEGQSYIQSENQTVAPNSDAILTFSLTGLAPGTTYYVRAQAANNWGNSYYNNNDSFTTLAAGGLPPTITTLEFTNITTSGALALMTLDQNAGDTGTYWVEYSKVSSFATFSSTPPSTYLSEGKMGVAMPANIVGLDPGTTYYVRAKAQNAYGIGVRDNGENFTTTTVPTGTAPQIFILPPYNITAYSMTVSVNINTGDPLYSGTAWIEYSIDSTFATFETLTPQAYAAGSAATAMIFDLTGLTPKTAYYIRARAANVWGNGTDVYASSVTTLGLNTAPIIVSFTVNGYDDYYKTVSATISAISYDGKVTVTLECSDEPTFYKPIYSAPVTAYTKPPLPTTLDVVSPKLLPGTTYYFRASAMNNYGTSILNNGDTYTTPPYIP